MKRTNKVSKEDIWFKHMKSWEASGLSQQAFCAQQQLNFAQFGYWRKRCKHKAASVSPIVKEHAHAWIELSTPPSPPPLKPVFSSRVLIELAGGCKLTIPLTDDSRPLIALFTALGLNDVCKK